MSDKKPENKTPTFLEALLAAKKELEPVSKDKTNPFHKSKYADINAYLEVVEPILQQHNIILLQPITFGIDTDPTTCTVKTELVYALTGEKVESALHLPANTDPQKIGSAITYYRRYTLASLLGMQADDDDANRASKGTDKAADADEARMRLNADKRLQKALRDGEPYKIRFGSSHRNELLSNVDNGPWLKNHLAKYRTEMIPEEIATIQLRLDTLRDEYRAKQNGNGDSAQ